MRAIFVIALLCTLMLAGCSTPDRPSPGSGFPRHYIAMQVPEAANFTGITVQGVLSGGGNLLTINATASNTGDRTYRVETGCSQPWREDFFKNDMRRQIREPTFRCLGFSLQDFAPGETISYQLSWNGTMWNDASRRYVPADRGEYIWAAQFAVYASNEHFMRFDLDYPVTVA